MDTISAKHYQELKQIEQLVRNHYKFESFDKVLSLWKLFVDEINSGYVGLIYDYENDLYKRNILQEFIDRASQDLKSELILILEPTDTQFINQTTQVNDTISNVDIAKENPQKYFWYYRVPKNISDDLKPDLDEHGRK